MKRSLFNAGSRQFIGGLALHESELPAVAAVCTVPAIVNLYMAVQFRHQGFQEAIACTRQSLGAQHDAREAGRIFIEASRDVLVPYLGSDWSAAWRPTGFAAGSLAVPLSTDRVVETLGSLERYFKKNPAQQNAAVNVTEVLAKQARENLELAVSSVARCRRDQRTNRNLRDHADGTLNELLVKGRKVLAAVLPAEDPRWLDFRPDVPGDLDRPDQVEGVQCRAGAAGHLSVNWPAAARADRYVVQVLVEGEDETFRNYASVQDTSVDVSVTPGAKVQVRVISRNATGPTVPSETVNATAPLAAVA